MDNFDLKKYLVENKLNMVGEPINEMASLGKLTEHPIFQSTIDQIGVLFKALNSRKIKLADVGYDLKNILMAFGEKAMDIGYSESSSDAEFFKQQSKEN
jgi:hypothetical protein